MGVLIRVIAFSVFLALKRVYGVGNGQTSYDEMAKSKVKPVLTSLAVAECDDQPGIPGGERLASQIRLQMS